LEINFSFQHKYGYIRDGLSQFIDDTGGTSVPVREFNLIACTKSYINLTVGIKSTMRSLPASQAHCTAAQHTSPLSHQDRFRLASCLAQMHVSFTLIVHSLTLNRIKLEMRGKAKLMAHSATQCRPLASSSKKLSCHLANMQ